MQKSDPLIHTKLRPPFTRSSLVSRPRLHDQIAQGLRGPLTVITAPAGFGKTTLVASCIPSCGMPLAWLSLDKNDNQEGRFLNYVIAALQEIDNTIGSEAAQLVVSGQAPDTILTSLVNDLDTNGKEVPFGVGIPGMRERLRQHGGYLEVHSNGAGTTITAVVPLPRSAGAAAT